MWLVVINGWVGCVEVVRWMTVFCYQICAVLVGLPWVSNVAVESWPIWIRSDMMVGNV